MSLGASIAEFFWASAFAHKHKRLSTLLSLLCFERWLIPEGAGIPDSSRATPYAKELSAILAESSHPVDIGLVAKNKWSWITIPTEPNA